MNLNRIKLVFHLLRNMGWSYLVFRIGYEIKLKSGLLKKSYPTNPPRLDYPTHESWKKSISRFFDLHSIRPDDKKANQLSEKVARIKKGEIPFFDSLWTNLGNGYDWISNPQSGFKYQKNQHWTKINDFSREQGDIKFVWEKSRFVYFYKIIRYDRYSGEDQGHWIISEILSWIEANPINCGPNYKCSQEIALRTMNWLYALNYYGKHAALTPEVFSTLMHHVYWQMDHVYRNIDFSRKAVRNNHILTEALALCSVGTLLPQLPGAVKWAQDGRQWFEEALQYQVFDDGSYLQYSMNYHRAVVQLLTMAIFLGKHYHIPWDPIVFEKAKLSLQFLLFHLQSNGHLPNHGANDGALFFPLSDHDFRDYRPQLNALHHGLFGHSIFNTSASREELAWLGVHESFYTPYQPKSGVFEFVAGGYYGFRGKNSFTGIRCGSHPFRPSQADNLHLDLWYDGTNVMRDSGSYQYNTESELIVFFSGTRSHNTVMINGSDQMEKGPRFIWLNWSQAVEAVVNETDDFYVFEGKIHAFKQLGDKIIHRRKVTKYKNSARWLVEDEIIHPDVFEVTQIWNPNPHLFDNLSITASDQYGMVIDPMKQDGWFSNSYGHKERTKQILFTARTRIISTELTL